MAKILVSDNKLFNYKSKGLSMFEPERKESTAKKIVTTGLIFLIIMLVILLVVVTKLGEIGNEKSQTISMISKSYLLYNMTS